MTAVRSDFAIEQNWQAYSEEEHAIWRLLFERQQPLLVGRELRNLSQPDVIREPRLLIGGQARDLP